jgi:hypothetical protein
LLLTIIASSAMSQTPVIDITPVGPEPNVTVPLWDAHYFMTDMIKVEITFRNLGTMQASDVTVWAVIYKGDIAGVPVYAKKEVIEIPGNGGTTKVTFPTFRPDREQIYVMRVYSEDSLDENIANNELTWPFRVVPDHPAVNIRAWYAALLPSHDVVYPIHAPVPVQATFDNQAAMTVEGASAAMTIADESGTVVYREKLTVAPMPPLSMMEQSFPAFVPHNAGTYCATAWIDHHADPYKYDDTAHWCFSASSSSGIAPDSPRREGAWLTIYPNPAREVATLEFKIPPGVPAHVLLFDGSGRQMGKLAELHEKGEGHIALGFDGLPSGTYRVVIESSEGVIAGETITIQH